MTILPMVLIPTYLVPLSILLHLASLAKLRKTQAGDVPAAKTAARRLGFGVSVSATCAGRFAAGTKRLMQ